ncbi:alkyl sulfatase dimerization domain-containing protein [Variovorax humicola]|uniref:Alkyl sulfatase dimerization domain-containing protein n=1 Tax=Variovorax humicola TaxID=1769758 RepID=A0ABU8W697_9BURK
MRSHNRFIPFALSALFVASVSAHAADMNIKPASAATLAANKAFAAGRTLASAQETEDANRGFIAALDMPQISDAKGNSVWDITPFDAIKGPAPDTVNPSLWESAKLTAKHGLFKIAEGIYQVRNYDLANVTLVAGKTGWIVIDPIFSAENAKAAMDLVNKHVGRKPVSAIIYTHSHADHFGGVRGIVDEADVKAGKVKVIAPEGFMENSVAENVLAGNVMNRRVSYQFGVALPTGPQGLVGTGVATRMSTGTIGLIAPTDLVTKTGQEMTVDGVRTVFQMAQGSEAPSEMMFYFPDLKVLCWSEDVNKTMHNVYTPRGAKVRDALSWSKYNNELIDLFPDAELAFGPHTWPTWGKENIRKTIVNQRDMYRFIHDQAMFLANQGKKMDDLANATFYPKGLQDDLSTRGYYGSLSHNLRGVYSFYLGYYDGNPANLNRYAPAETSRRYVAEFGGVEAVLAKGRKAFAAGDYRWTAEMVNHAVMAAPENADARALQADALEQLGYQVENGIWRNNYLSAALELRKGIQNVRISTQGPDLLRAMSPTSVFDLLAVRLNHEKADGLNVGINVKLTDSGDNYALELSNSVLNNTRGRVLKNAQASLALSTPALMKMTIGKVPLPELIQAGEAKLEGDSKALGAVFANLETPNPQFNLVTPVTP